jgi:hypothetical protein
MLRCFVWPALTRRFAPPSPRAELSYLTGRGSEASPLSSGSLVILFGGVVPSSRPYSLSSFTTRGQTVH